MTILKKDQIITAEITDTVNSKEFIISFDGRLIRVMNESAQELQVGQKVKLKVSSVDPLGFQMVKHQRGKSSIDVVV